MSSFTLLNCVYYSYEVTLRLNDKGLKKIPNNVQHFKNLTYLEINHNMITEIPEFIYELTKLEYLSFTGNFIKTVSPKIKKLINLKTLKLNNNNILVTPNEVHRLPKLNLLYLYDNPCKKCMLYAKPNENNKNSMYTIYKSAQVIQKFFQVYQLCSLETFDNNNLFEIEICI